MLMFLVSAEKKPLPAVIVFTEVFSAATVLREHRATKTHYKVSIQVYVALQQVRRMLRHSAHHRVFVSITSHDHKRQACENRV